MSGHLRRWLILAGLALACGACRDRTAQPALTSVAPSAATAASAPTTSPPTTTAPRPEFAPVTTAGPVEGGNGQATAAVQDLAAAGYVETEYFVSGDAQRFEPVGTLGPDGRWGATPAGTAPLSTRIIVRRPADPARFSGTVFVEWLNVTAGADGDPDWGYTSDELIRRGHIWVGVSAQAVGVSSLQSGDPVRYAALSHPGDPYSFDMFSLAAEALSSHDGPAPLGDDVTPTKIVAIGESQSATFLTTYINAVHRLTNVFDGFFVHSRLGRVPDLGRASLGASGGLTPTIRTDLAVPTMIFATETDLTVLGYHAARQDDTATVRTWEVAGTAHADSYLLDTVYGSASQAVTAACPTQINSGPQHEVLQAGLRHFDAWVRGGEPPPMSPRVATMDDPTSPYGIAIERDGYGNAVGGIRTPAVDMPIATLSGDPAAGAPGFCLLFGSTTPFDAATLAALYPNHEAYVTAYAQSLDAAVAAGFILPADAEPMLAAATASTIGE